MARVVLIGGICGACASAVPAWRSGYVVSGDMVSGASAVPRCNGGYYRES